MENTLGYMVKTILKGQKIISALQNFMKDLILHFVYKASNSSNLPMCIDWQTKTNAT